MYIKYINGIYLTTVTRIHWMSHYNQNLIDLVDVQDDYRLTMFEKDILDCDPVIVCGAL